MVKNKFWPGILTLVLVFGMTVAGCNLLEPDRDGSATVIVKNENTQTIMGVTITGKDISMIHDLTALIETGGSKSYNIVWPSIKSNGKGQSLLVRFNVTESSFYINDGTTVTVTFKEDGTTSVQ
jgi:hypothetical protein